MHGLKLLSQNGTLTEKEKCSLMSLEELSHVNMIVHLIQGCITGHTQISCECALVLLFVSVCVYFFPFLLTSYITHHKDHLMSLRALIQQEALRRPFQEHSFASSCSISACSGFDFDSRGALTFQT